MSLFTRRWRSAAAVTAAITVAAAVATSSVGAAGGARSTSGTIWFAANPRSTSTLLYVGGNIKDKVLGEGAVTFTIKPFVNPKGRLVAKVNKATVWTATGSLTGTGSGNITVTNKPKQGDSTISGGVLDLTKGTGALKGHSLKATFTGAGNVSGALYTLHYRGTYK